jgi:hypothetical protein
MDIVGSNSSEHILLNLTCPHCQLESFLTIKADDKAFGRKPKTPKEPAKLLGTAPRSGQVNGQINGQIGKQISKDELLDFHNFLKNFDGNFEEKINRKKSNN